MKRLNLTLTALIVTLFSFAQTRPTTNLKFQQFIDVYNTGDMYKYCGWYAAETADDKLIESSVHQSLDEYAISGKLNLVKVKAISVTQTILIARAETSGNLFEMLWTTDAQQHYKGHQMLKEIAAKHNAD